MQNVKIVVYGLVSRSESCPTEFGSQCVWISHGDRLTFGAIEYLKKKPTCPDGGAVTAREEADAVLCSKDKPLQQTVVAMEHVPRHRVLVVLTAAGVGGVGEAGVDGDDKVDRSKSALRIFADDSLDGVKQHSCTGSCACSQERACLAEALLTCAAQRFGACR